MTPSVACVPASSPVVQWFSRMWPTGSEDIGRAMLARALTRRWSSPTAAGALVGLAGLGFVGIGLWGRRDVRRALEREEIISTLDAASPNELVAGARAARSMADVIRRNTLAATGGRTYAAIDPYVDEDGIPTADGDRAARDERTGGRLENPEHALWVQSTTLQAALMQAYMAFRLAELTVALGVAFVATGAGIAALEHRASAR